ncbi:MAG TPA: ABC-F family ATP-binding cassette domain-containing protein [Acidimicrobiales bacterium]|nr:ABC-F family ATP-binding cassette domain-containing protein [Acidimicrobiales bacterium]
MPPSSPFRRTSPSISLATSTLTARQLRFERGGQTVLDGVSLTVGSETCLGVVGPNGVGKSTLLQLLAGQLEPADGGVVRVDPPTATVGYLSQEHDHDARETVRDALYRRTGAAAAEAEMTMAAAALGDGRPQAEDDYATALARYESLGAADFEARLAGVLEQVGLPASMAERSSGALSGGQEARVALAAILLARFDITLLDEPTNDLDFDGLARLEEMVARRRGGMVIVSHDRAFLDRTVTDVLEIEEHTRRARAYGGGWAGYLAERAAERTHAEEAYAVYQSQRTELARRAQRERQWATSGVSKEKKNPRDNDKAQRDFRINRTERLASRARRTERAMEALEVVEKPWEGWDLRFSINEATRSGTVVAHLDDAVLERGDFVLGPFTLDIAWADRVALIGPNGSGKTTLVEALLGRLPLVAGTRRIGPSVVIGELGQDRRVLSDASSSVVDAFMAASGLPMSSARSQLAKFGLSAAAVVRPPSSLSPGERTRAELAAFAAKGVNFLVLDEPTNHLDLPAIEQLESALDGYEGTLLLVSHDRRLLESVTVTRRVVLPGRDQAFRGLREDR